MRKKVEKLINHANAQTPANREKITSDLYKQLNSIYPSNNVSDEFKQNLNEEKME